MSGTHTHGTLTTSNGWNVKYIAGGRGLSGAGGARVLLVLSEPRAWKGRAGLGPEARERLAREAPGADLIVLFGHPRLAAEVPGERPLLLAWHRQRLMQEAVARWLAARAT